MRFLFLTFCFLIFQNAFGQTKNIVNDTGSIICIIPELPHFPGGDDAFRKYLQDTIHYPAEAKAKGIEGTVYVQFTIEKDGSITNVNAVKTVTDSPDLTEEAIRAISNMPKWVVPNDSQHPYVPIVMTQPIRFSLGDQKNEKEVNKYQLTCEKAKKTGIKTNNQFNRKPEYPGGDTAFNNFLFQQQDLFIAFNDKFNKDSMQISFVVDSLGNVTDLTVIRSLKNNPDLTMAVANHFCGMKNWIPGGNGINGKKKTTNSNVFVTAMIYFGRYEKGQWMQKPSVKLYYY
jgi:TonB family protein